MTGRGGKSARAKSQSGAHHDWQERKVSTSYKSEWGTSMDAVGAHNHGRGGPVNGCYGVACEWMLWGGPVNGCYGMGL